jgi:hypothetical protein
VSEPGYQEGPFEERRVRPAASPAVPRRPENFLDFRLGRLLILLASMPQMRAAKPLHIERLGYYDFFSDNPFLILEQGDPDHLALQLAGFSQRTLSYNSSAQRFSNRRARLRHDLALLASRALVEIAADGSHITFSASDRGVELAERFTGLYAKSFRAGVAVVVRRLNKLSDRAIGERSREWLRAEPFLIDIYGQSEELS